MNGRSITMNSLRHIFLLLHSAALVVGLSGLVTQTTLAPASAQQDAAPLNIFTPTNQLKQSQSDETAPETPVPDPPLETVPSSPESGTTLPNPIDPPTAPDRLDVEPSPSEPELPTPGPSPPADTPDTVSPDPILDAPVPD